MEKPLVDKDYQLQRLEYNGAIAYVEIPEIPMGKAPFGMLKVKGKIDDYEFSGVRLVLLGNGNLVLPVKSAIKKIIKEEAPERVHVTIYEDATLLIIPKELLLCMEDADGVLAKFEKYRDAEKRAFINWIYSAKTEQTKVDRIAKTMIMIQNGEKFYKAW